LDESEGRLGAQLRLVQPEKQKKETHAGELCEGFRISRQTLSLLMTPESVLVQPARIS
jgi:hypothetical protein